MATDRKASREGPAMMDRLIRLSIENRGAVLLLTVLGGIAGWWAFQSLPIDAVPDITNNQVQVNTPVAGLAPEEIERTITFPIESAMSGLAGVEQVRSITRFGLSQVTVVFHDELEIFSARQRVLERLQTVSGNLPSGAHPELGPVTTGLGEVFHYTLEVEKPDADPDRRVEQLMELRAIQEWIVKPRLLTVSGVAEVNTIGGYEKQFHIQPVPGRLARHGIHFSDIEEAIEAANQNVGGGYVEQTAEQFLVQGIGLFRSIDEVRQVPVKALESLKTLRLGEIADVHLGKELRTGSALVNGREAVLGTVLMLLGENSRTVSERVGERIREITSALPKGVVIRTLYDRSTLVNATLDTVLHNLGLGAFLVVVILFALVGNLRAAAITAFVIPLSLLGTFFFMRRYGISGNLMSLGALDFGIIVDATVIVLDNCVRVVHERAKNMGRGLSRAEVSEAVGDATVEIRTAAGFGGLIIVAVFLPVFALAGVEGKMFRPMAAAFVFALVTALVLSFTAVPALASLLLRGSEGDREPALMRWIREGYAWLLEIALRWRRGTLAGGALAVVLGVLLFSRLGGEFLPQLDEGSLVFQFVRPVNISLTQSIALQSLSETVIISFPEVQAAFSRIGTSEIATDPMGVNLADTYVILNPRASWPSEAGRARTKGELAQAIYDRLQSEVPGQRPLVSQPIQMRFNELLEGTRADVSVKVFGEDMDVLSRVTRQVSSVIESVPGAGDVELELKGTSPLLQVEPRRDVLNRYGVSVKEVLETVSLALGGDEVGFLFEGVRRYPLVLRLDESIRQDLREIRSLPVGVAANATLPLEEVARVGFTETHGSITREETKRRAAVLVNPRGRDTQSFVQEAMARVQREVTLPPGYYVEWGGNFKNLEEASRRLLVLGPLALALVLAMVYAAFGNLAQTLLVMSCVPLAPVGGVLALLAVGLPFSITAGIGFIALSGIAVLNGVVLVNFYNELSARGLSGPALAKEGALVRLRPVLMTALVDVFGFLPMMLSAGVGAEVQRPLATVVIGGVASSTLLTLFVLPAAFCFLEGKRAVRSQQLKEET